MGHTSSSNLNVLVLVGSLRRQSYNRGLVNYLLENQEFKTSGIKAHVPNLSQIPFYNQDYEDDKRSFLPNQEIPPQVNDLVKLCIKSDVLVFSTP